MVDKKHLTIKIYLTFCIKQLVVQTYAAMCTIHHIISKFVLHLFSHAKLKTSTDFFQILFDMSCNLCQ